MAWHSSLRGKLARCSCGGCNICCCCCSGGGTGSIRQRSEAVPPTAIMLVRIISLHASSAAPDDADLAAAGVLRWISVAGAKWKEESSEDAAGFLVPKRKEMSCAAAAADSARN